MDETNARPNDEDQPDAATPDAGQPGPERPAEPEASPPAPTEGAPSAASDAEAVRADEQTEAGAELPDRPTGRQDTVARPPLTDSEEHQRPAHEGRAVAPARADDNLNVIAGRHEVQARPATSDGRQVAPARHSPMLRVLAVSNLVLMAALLVILCLYRPWGLQQAPGAQSGLFEQLKPTDGRKAAPTATPEPEQPAAATRNPEAAPLSWSESEKMLFAGRYRQALDGYRSLLRESQRSVENRLVSDLLQLRTAQCLAHLGQAEEAVSLYASVAKSDAPILRAAAQSKLAARDLMGGQYLKARRLAYSAIAALAATDLPLALQTDCDFLIARALSQEVLSHYGAPDAVQWRPLTLSDPFAGLSESDIPGLLAEGARRLDQAVLGPQVQPAASGAAGQQYAVSAKRASIDGLLASFAARAGVDVKWVSGSPETRRRSLSIWYSRVSGQRLSEVACGAVGLLARFTGKEVLVHDPQSLDALSQRRELLFKEATSVWRRLFLRAPDDPRIPEGHLALATLQEHAGQAMEAMRGYQLIAQRFAGQDVAPLALLRSAAVRIRLRDYCGARADLLAILDRYPDCPSYDKVYLQLGNATMQAGLLDEAMRAFGKLYYLNFTADSRRDACLGAARCSYLSDKPEKARQWATRYIGLAGPDAANVAEAYLLLGKSEAKLGRPDEAIAAFRQALANKPTPKRRVELLLALAGTYAEKGQFVEAVAVLSRCRSMELTPEQLRRYLIRTSETYREMGLAERACEIIRGRARSTANPKLRTALAMELALCYRDQTDWESVAAILTEIIPDMEPGPTARRAACLLAEAALKLGKTQQAIAVADGLLGPECEPDIRRKARQIMGSAYVDQHDYARAAVAFSGLDSAQEGPEK